MVNEQLDIFDFMYEDFKYDTTRPIRIIELFAGIGTQRMAFDKLGVDYEVVAISEVDKFAILSYAIIHTDYLDIRNTYFDTHTHTPLEMATVLQKKNVGINFKNMKHTIHENTNIETLRDYFLADKLSGNLGDISKVKGIDMPLGIDLMTYSFPCTDLSKAGKQEGLSNTRSGLVYEVFRIVEELKEINNKPTTLLMENVIDLIQAKFVNEFNEMQLDLERFGYQNYNFVMNSKDFGVAQNRERVFMVSLPKDTNYKEPLPFKLDKSLKDYLEDEADESYYLSDIQINQINSKTRRGRVGKQEANTLTTSCNQGVVTKYPRIIDDKSSSKFKREPQIEVSPTILCDARFKVEEDDVMIRKLTPRECWRLMGIDDSYFDKANGHISDSQLYKQAGNAIVVDVIYYIVKSMI